MSGGDGRLVVREMGYTLAEFSAVLPQAMRDWRVIGGPGDWSVDTADGAAVARIRVEHRPDRVMGSLRLPVLQVELRLAGPSPALDAEFLRRFDRGFQRGGG